MLFCLSYVSTRYSRIAPDSQRVIPVLGSSMAGTRPLMLTDSYGCFFISGNWRNLDS